ncbi:hypothetical protein Tco_0598551, partial [Tanacetum coccineum]
IKERLMAAREPLEFSVGDQVLLKVSHWKGVVRFGKKGKLVPRLVSRAKVIENQVMEAPAISISSDTSDESVGFPIPRVILFGSIPIEVPIVPVDLPIAPEVRAAVVASPASVLELDTYSSSKSGPLEGS